MANPRGRPKKRELMVSDAQREELQRIARQSRSRRSVAFRARIILRCAAGTDNAAVARNLKTTGFTVGFWRNRFIAGGVDALLDEPRPGAPRKLGDDAIGRVVKLTLESVPKGATHWSTRSLADKTGMRQSAISRIWRAFGLQPHRTQSFQLSSDPFLIEKVRDIVGLYMNPPDHAVVVCVDEKTQIQALSRSQPILPLRPGEPERRTHDYERHGTTSLFAALDVATGAVIGRCFQRHRSLEFKKFLDHLHESLPGDLEVHIVLDNYSTHKTPLIRRWFARQPRLICTLPLRTDLGLTLSNAGSDLLQNVKSNVARIAALYNSNRPSEISSRLQTTSPKRSSGPNPLTRSSPASTALPPPQSRFTALDLYNKSLTHHTSPNLRSQKMRGRSQKT